MQWDIASVLIGLLGAPAIIGAIIWTAKVVAERKVNSLFDHKLEHYKHDLGLLAETARFDLSRRLEDFNRFSTKRHEVYASLYRRLRKAADAVDVATQLIYIAPALDKFSREDLDEWMKRNRLTQAEMSGILAAYGDSDQSKFEDLCHNALQNSQVRRARQLTQHAVNAFVLNELYLSPTVHSLTFQSLQSMQRRTGNVITRFEADPPATELHKVLAAMQKELAIGDYVTTTSLTDVTVESTGSGKHVASGRRAHHEAER